MKLEKPINENYAATVVELKNTVDLENCDNIQATHIFGNQVIVSKDAKVGDVGIFFPAETQLSNEYASNNNLYRHSDLNVNKDEKGYIEDNRRIKTAKFRGHQSCGLFMPLDSLSFCCNPSELKIGDTFDKLDETVICNKYVVKRKSSGGMSNKKGKTPKISKLIDGQFRLHEDTSQLGKNLHHFSPDDYISVTYKMHGTSVVISKVLCKKKLKITDKIFKKVGVNIVDTEYDNIYSSRRVVKNDDINTKRHFYSEDIWKLANDQIKDFLLYGMTIYAEIVGYIPNGGDAIQKGYDYGCGTGQYDIYVYRITYTNIDGHIFEFSHRQMKQWCDERGIKIVPELYYGLAKDIISNYNNDLDFRDNFYESLKTLYLEKDCFICRNKVPAEGVVVRKDVNHFLAFKLKSFKFLLRETKELDKGTVDIEEDQTTEEE